MLGSYTDAMDNFKRAMNLKPHCPEIGREIAHLDQVMKKERDNERAVYNNMFQTSNPGTQKLKHQKEKIDDDTFAEISEQLRAFSLDSTQSRMPLPGGMESIMGIVESICSELNLSVMTEGRGDQEHTVIKKK